MFSTELSLYICLLGISELVTLSILINQFQQYTVSLWTQHGYSVLKSPVSVHIHQVMAQNAIINRDLSPLTCCAL